MSDKLFGEMVSETNTIDEFNDLVARELGLKVCPVCYGKTGKYGYDHCKECGGSILTGYVDWVQYIKLKGKHK